MTPIFALLLAAAVFGAAQAPPAQPSRVTRASVTALEQAFDAKVHKASVADPMELMCSAQAVYVDGFGIVLTAQVDLISTPTVSPFRLTISKTDTQRIRARKADHLPLLRQIMQQTMLEAAALPALPPNERVVVAVSLFRMNWEDSTGLPAQIVMQASRQKLLDHAAQNAIQVQEF